DPNPAPSSGAVSETFVSAGTTVIVAVPAITTTVVVVGVTITLAPGGTPVNAPVPSGISMPGAVTPTWSANIIPQTSVASVTFTYPPSFTTVVPVPTASNAPPQNVTGPPGATNNNGDDWWLLIFGGLIGGLLPPGVGIPGGTTPTAAPRIDWTGSWTDPDPISTSNSHSTSASSSATSASSCPLPTPGYSLSDDSENADWEADGTDPDRKRDIFSNLTRRDKIRSIAVNKCPGLFVKSPSFVALTAGQYYSIGTKAAGGTNTILQVTNVGSRPFWQTASGDYNSHRLGYIDQFFELAMSPGITCTWIGNNVFNYVRVDGSSMGSALLAAIDQVSNMFWVDKPLNQAKSNVVNGNKLSATDPPQSSNINGITDFQTSANTIQDVEYFARNFAALGGYFGNTAGSFRATALRVQNLLSEITPDTPEANLPVEFNTWLRGLISTYPTGCTTRATNVFNYYVARMNTVSGTTGVNPVPACFPLYHSVFTPTTFNFQSLLRPTPTVPNCNIPGTTGQLSVGADAQGFPIISNPTLTTRIMGSGNTDFYAIDDGANLAGSHYVGDDLSSSYNGQCQGVYQIVRENPGPGFTTANIALNCNGQAGKVVAPFNWLVNNQQLVCVILSRNDGTNAFFHICGPSTGAATACANA
ncbi:hypothetical protein DFH08DRAFT_984259, partial [Mycena albidolilacea]